MQYFISIFSYRLDYIHEGSVLVKRMQYFISIFSYRLDYIEEGLCWSCPCASSQWSSSSKGASLRLINTSPSGSSLRSNMAMDSLVVFGERTME
ncbi:unnamed protein product [Urochloa humidicola]